MKKLFFILFCLFFIFFQNSSFAATKAGTDIVSSAEVRYGGISVISNIVTQEVAQIYGLELSPMSQEASSGPGTTHYFSHVLTNIGNGSDMITFSVIEVTPDAWSAFLVRDVNMNGVYDDGIDIIVGQSTSEVLSEEGAYYLLLAVTSPSTAESSGSALLRITSEADDGPAYLGINGVIYGGDDLIEIRDTVNMAIENLRIMRDDLTGDITLSWEGGSADIYYLEDFSADFSLASLEASSVASPYISTVISAQDGRTRYYRAAIPGTMTFALGIVGKFDIPVSVGINELSLPLVPYDDTLSHVIGTQVTGARNAFDSDRIWKYNPASDTGYDYAWLVDGVGPPYDGQWYTGNYPTDLTIDADEGFVLQIRDGHPATYVTVVGKVSETDRSIPISIGMNFVGTCFPVEVPLGDQDPTGDSNLWESGATGARNAFDADRVWKYNPASASGYDYAWLVDGVGPAYDGLWYTGNYPTTIKLKPGFGYWIQVRDDHSGFTWTYKKPY